jgi:NAD(P)-dependent dehydrogenase (short-subunit alcohol dehydrogenase family)
MTRDLNGKRVLLTGASGGIGRALARELVKAGAKVALAARNADKLASLADELKAGGNVVTAPTDVTKDADRQGAVTAAVAAFGGLDILLNNAGVGSWGHFADSTEAINRQVMETNFFGPIELTRVAVPHLSNGHQPAVVNVTSMCGRKGMPAWPEYSASKFALVGMSEAWRAEFQRFGIDVLTVVPGMTDSGFRNNWLRADGKADLRFDAGMTPEYLAGKIVSAIRANITELVVGSEAKRLLRFNRYFPRLTNWLVSRKVKRLYAK